MSREDLVLPWRPLFTLVKEVFYSKHQQLGIVLYSRCVYVYAMYQMCVCVCACVRMYVHACMCACTCLVTQCGGVATVIPDFVETRQGQRIPFCCMVLLASIHYTICLFLLEIQTRTFTKVVHGGLMGIIVRYIVHMDMCIFVYLFLNCITQFLSFQWSE